MRPHAPLHGQHLVLGSALCPRLLLLAVTFIPAAGPAKPQEFRLEGSSHTHVLRKTLPTFALPRVLKIY